jgi:hypothetical protein
MINFFPLERTENAIPVPAAHRLAPNIGVSALEQGFPHVVEKIQMMWGHPELDAYLRQVALDERGQRKGFSPEAWSEIHFLAELHQRIARHAFL